MKRLLYFIAIATLIVSCESYNDQFDGYDDNDITLTKEVEYTLTEDDYATVNKELTTYLTSDYPDTIAIPIVLDDVYPTLNDGSVVYATFDYYIGENIAYIDSINSWKADAAYTLTTDDYDGMGTSDGEPGKYDNFSSSVDPDDYLPDFLNDLYANESDGFSTIIFYKYYASSVTSTVLAKYTLSASATVDESYKMKSADYQIIVDYVSNAYGSEYINKYGTGDYYYGADAYYSEFHCASKYWNGDVFDTWEDAVSEAIETILLPAKYTATDLTDGYIVAVDYKYYTTSNTAKTKTDYYKYTGSSWSKINLRSWTSSSPVTLSDDVTAYVLTDDDYDEMGISNFGTAVSTDNYIPTFLSTNSPYAQKNDKVAILYKYKKGDDILTQATEYAYTEGQWTATGYTTTDTEQYVKTNGKWIYVGATLYTMVKGTETGNDYQLIVDYVLKKYGESYIDVYKGQNQGERYYGVNSFYGEFRYESKYWNGDVFDSWEDAVSDALAVVFLPSKYPKATVDDEFVITFAMYDGDMHDYTASFICTAAGDTPTFKETSAPAAE